MDLLFGTDPLPDGSPLPNTGSLLSISPRLADDHLDAWLDLLPQRRSSGWSASTRAQS